MRIQWSMPWNAKPMASFPNELSQQTWERVLKTDDVNQACDSVLHIFMDIFNKHCPTKQSSPK